MVDQTAPAATVQDSRSAHTMAHAACMLDSAEGGGIFPPMACDPLVHAALGAGVELEADSGPPLVSPADGLHQDLVGSGPSSGFLRVGEAQEAEAARSPLAVDQIDRFLLDMTVRQPPAVLPPPIPTTTTCQLATTPAEKSKSSGTDKVGIHSSGRLATKPTVGLPSMEKARLVLLRKGALHRRRSADGM